MAKKPGRSGSSGGLVAKDHGRSGGRDVDKKGARAERRDADATAPVRQPQLDTGESAQKWEMGKAKRGRRASQAG